MFSNIFYFIKVALIFILSCSLAGVCFADIYNPQPHEDDFILPMPDGAVMAFRTIAIGAGDDKPFALRKFKMGDPDGGFNENPTNVVIGGSFIENHKGKSDWVYYLGKYEATEAQYYSIITPPENQPELKSSQYPMTNVSWFEVNSFIDKYNQWLFNNCLEKLPTNEERFGFLRLPTEIEWEFAARGGVEVTPDNFDRKYPYTEGLEKYEWFFGPKSSHGKLKKVGLLKPNILNFHDILGNVSEMTSSLYQIEYYQGRTGGFVARGGHFKTQEKMIRSSLRFEESFYNFRKGFAPNRKSFMGFRLVISSLIYPTRNSKKKYSAAWKNYRGSKSKGASLPAAVSVSSVSTQIDIQKEDVLIHFNRIKRELTNRNTLNESVLREMGLLEAALADIAKIRQNATEESAYAWTKIAGERGFFLYRELRKLPQIRNLINTTEKAGLLKKADRFKKRESEIVKNIDEALSTYSETFRQLETIDLEAVRMGFTKYLSFLKKRNAQEQIKILITVKGHCDIYRSKKRANIDKWRHDFIELSR